MGATLKLTMAYGAIIDTDDTEAPIDIGHLLDEELGGAFEIAESVHHEWEVANGVWLLCLKEMQSTTSGSVPMLVTQNCTYEDPDWREMLATEAHRLGINIGDPGWYVFPSYE